jgi:hypothetical protein
LRTFVLIAPYRQGGKKVSSRHEIGFNPLPYPLAIPGGVGCCSSVVENRHGRDAEVREQVRKRGESRKTLRGVYAPTLTIDPVQNS